MPSVNDIAKKPRVSPRMRFGCREYFSLATPRIDTQRVSQLRRSLVILLPVVDREWIYEEQSKSAWRACLVCGGLQFADVFGATLVNRRLLGNARGRWFQAVTKGAAKSMDYSAYGVT